MDTPWKSFAPVEPGREYLVLLSYLPLKTYLKIPQFLRFTFQIQNQIAQSPGAVGYSLRAQPLSRQFWTLSAWQDSRGLMEFVRQLPHCDVMKALTPYMAPTKFTEWKILGSAIPPNWDDAVQRLAQET
jgi:hypothetical protein